MSNARWLIATLLIVVAIGCRGSERGSEQSAEDGTARVTALADSYVKEYFEAFRYMALLSGAPDVHPDRLADNSLRPGSHLG